ncbi:RING finger protein [Rickettsiales endosymbiont of Stachyamoeba lipophora]|uniref:hypothetical protein n=1 Tax=Rickettsiales endosymbiont of Stachyamoeba lipophora TaxID=2486578 RepID=UPI000F64F035|nr:hypothetical protein [Rickettsiales endosymbiont of Stachyamoeba lipophora]AZL15511.1 hypothetical protein EF513_02950 [Rickettsiales endosymbiont of Stachyamoeba lipophora]
MPQFQPTHHSEFVGNAEHSDNPTNIDRGYFIELLHKIQQFTRNTTEQSTNSATRVIQACKRFYNSLTDTQQMYLNLTLYCSAWGIGIGAVYHPLIEYHLYSGPHYNLYRNIGLTALGGGIGAASGVPFSAFMQYVFGPLFIKWYNYTYPERIAEVRRLHAEQQEAAQALPIIFNYNTALGKKINYMLSYFELEKIELNLDRKYDCLINKTPMREPIKAPDGQYYERAALQQWFNDGHKKCLLNHLKELPNPSTLPIDEQMQKELYEIIEAQFKVSTKAEYLKYISSQLPSISSPTDPDWMHKITKKTAGLLRKTNDERICKLEDYHPQLRNSLIEKLATQLPEQERTIFERKVTERNWWQKKVSTAEASSSQQK